MAQYCTPTEQESIVKFRFKPDKLLAQSLETICEKGEDWLRVNFLKEKGPMC